MVPAARVRDDLPGISEVVAQAGFGLAQVKAILLGGGTLFILGCQLLLVSCLAKSIASEWDLPAYEKGILVSVVFVGITCGIAFSGLLGDACGRRVTIILGHSIVIVFAGVSAFATSFNVLFALRLCLGIALGLGIAPWNVLNSEITPTRWRATVAGAAQSTFMLGQMFIALFIWWDEPTMKHLDWRFLTMVSAVPPMVLAILAYFFLTESPVYLASKGRFAEAREALRSILRANGVADHSADFRQDVPRTGAGGPGGVVQQLQTIFGWRLLYSTATVTFSCFAVNLTFYGTLYGLPQIHSHTTDTGYAPVVRVMIAAFWELPGVIAGAFLGMWFPRLPVLGFSFVGTTVSLVAFTTGMTMSGAWWAIYVLDAGLGGVKLFSMIAFAVVYLYAAEIYPETCRTTGAAICISGGKVGAVLAPMIFEVMVSQTGGYDVFFKLAAALMALNVGLVFFLPFETAGKSLDDHQADIQPLKQP